MISITFFVRDLALVWVFSLSLSRSLVQINGQIMQHHPGNNIVDQIVNKNAMRNNDRFLLFEILSNILNSQNVSLNIQKKKHSTAVIAKAANRTEKIIEHKRKKDH